MIRARFALAGLGLAAALAQTAVTPATTSPAFDAHFTDKTMRVDYFHTGGGDREIFALDRVVSDGPWAGSRTRLLDDTNLGPYFFEVDRPADEPGRSTRAASRRSTASGKRRTSRSSGSRRTFHESAALPLAEAPVQVVVKKRDRANAFREVWSTVVDPGSRFVNRADREARSAACGPSSRTGRPARRWTSLILGDGYTEAELPKFHADVKRLVDQLFATEPFKSRKDDFNVRADRPAVARESGVHRPQAPRRLRRTPVSTDTTSSTRSATR